MKRSKTHFHATWFTSPEGKKTIMFKGEDGTHMHWSGGSKDQPNVVLQKLVKTHGLKAGKSIYDDFNQALFDIAADQSPFRNPLSCLVLYKNDNKKSYTNDGVTAANQEIHS